METPNVKKLISFRQAFDLVTKTALKNFQLSETTDEITVNLLDSVGYTIRQEILSDRDYPPFNRSAMDGYAIRCADYLQGTRQFKCIATVFAGGTALLPDTDQLTDSCIRIMTGAAVPQQYDAVIKIEDTREIPASPTNENIANGADTVDQMIEVVTPQSDSNLKYQNISLQGEDLKNNQIIYKSGTQIHAGDLMALASSGHSFLKVKPPIKVAMITTGDEIIEVDGDKQPEWNQIRNSNAIMLEYQLSKNKCATLIEKRHVKDDPQEFRKQLSAMIEKADVFIFSGAVSMGAADFIPQTLASLGIENIFHKVAIKPGKPIWFGQQNRKLFFGLPGNPVSASLNYCLFIKPALESLYYGRYKVGKKIRVDLTNDQARLLMQKNKNSLDRFVAVSQIKTASQVLDRYKLINNHGSGDITALASSDGFIHLKSSNDTEGDKVIGDDALDQEFEMFGFQ